MIKQMAKMEVQTNWPRQSTNLSKSGRPVPVVLGKTTDVFPCFSDVFPYFPDEHYFLVPKNKYFQVMECRKIEQFVN